MQEPPKSKKGNITALWEYAAKSAVAHKEISEHEGIQVMQCWAEADQMQDNLVKATKFRTALRLVFGPLKGTTIHDLMRRRRDQTIQMLQEKQRQKRLQQQQMERTRITIDLTTEPSANTLPTENLTTSNNSLGAVHTGGNSEVSSAQQLWICNMAPLPLALLEPFLCAVLVHLRTVDLDGSFTFEITDEVLPGYTAAIKFPMNLTRMQRKLDGHQYLGILPFDSDIQLMISNCHKYHVRNSIFTKTALLLKKEWRRLLSDFQRHVCHVNEQSLPVALTADAPAPPVDFDRTQRVHLSNESAPYKRARTEETSEGSGEESAGEGNSTDEIVELAVLEPMIQKALNFLLSYDHNGDFAMEITDVGYLAEIKVPMDLTKMQRKLDAHQYSSLKQFDSDVLLMVRNCRKFNGRGSPFTKTSQFLQREWARRLGDFQLQLTYGTVPLPAPAVDKTTAREQNVCCDDDNVEEEVTENETEQKDFSASLMTDNTIGSNGAESDDDITLIDEVECSEQPHGTEELRTVASATFQQRIDILQWIAQRGSDADKAEAMQLLFAIAKGGSLPTNNQTDLSEDDEGADAESDDGNGLSDSDDALHTLNEVTSSTVQPEHLYKKRKLYH
uniref:Bromo domain-containing protein n=1 Tax=Spumella elongata TaxID=89044 RepID=A0A7S3H2V5_9STRA|mmetsp:Transcript_32400/g.55359  ORF Transcript_32400/g.55359 Transcript_32400/m.55359 type:complete len:617 (+) Transcript_32400:99-1949(+)